MVNAGVGVFLPTATRSLLRSHSVVFAFQHLQQISHNFISINWLFWSGVTRAFPPSYCQEAAASCICEARNAINDFVGAFRLFLRKKALFKLLMSLTWSEHASFVDGWMHLQFLMYLYHIYLFVHCITVCFFILFYGLFKSWTWKCTAHNNQ